MLEGPWTNHVASAPTEGHLVGRSCHAAPVRLTARGSSPAAAAQGRRTQVVASRVSGVTAPSSGASHDSPLRTALRRNTTDQSPPDQPSWDRAETSR